MRVDALNAGQCDSRLGGFKWDEKRIFEVDLTFKSVELDGRSNNAEL
jgi:hypothetical protein